MSKLELVKQLEYLVAFQTNCLNNGNWEDFDRVESSIKEIERKLIYHDASSE